MSDDRPNWDNYFIEIAKAVSLRGDCTRSKVGAVLVEDRTHRILSTGYNGTDPGSKGCLSGGCERGRNTYEDLPAGEDYGNCIAKHAERNCLEYAERYYPQREGAAFGWQPILFRRCSMYITRKPCADCRQLLGRAGVRRVVWPFYEEYSWGLPVYDSMIIEEEIL